MLPSRRLHLLHLRAAVCLLLFLVLSGAEAAETDRMRLTKIDHRQGLSNSAVLSIFQDNEGLMWFGTYDGVNCYDGKEMEMFRSDFTEPHMLSNNVIHSIQQADDNCLWINTHLGVNRFSKKWNKVTGSYEFKGDFVVHSNKKGDTWALGYDWISYYNTRYRRFMPVDVPDIRMLKVDSRAFVTDSGELFLFPYQSGDLYRFSLDAFDKDSLSVRQSVSSERFHDKTIAYICHQNGVFCFYDTDYELYLYDIARKSKIYLRNIKDLIQAYGDIMGIVPFYEDIIVAFHVNGLMRLRASQKYREEVIDRNLRVFAVLSDPRQGVLWVGTDGQGVIKYSGEYRVGSSLMLEDLSPEFSRQVRSIATDRHGNLWIGTKGDGLIRIKDYAGGIAADKTVCYSDGGRQSVLSYVRPGKETQVYSLCESRCFDGLWVGTGSGGLCFYSAGTDKLHRLPGQTDGLTDIHSIYEESDSVLYLIGANGLTKARVGRQGGLPRIEGAKTYRFVHGGQELYLFYSMKATSDSILWLGSRQKGLVRFNRKTETYRVFPLSEALHKSVDDVLCLHWDGKGKALYAGTTSGLVRATYAADSIGVHYIGKE